MADKKISQLADSTTPLAGTEVLPIVQSSTTKKVAVSDLTAGRTVAVASLQSNTGGSTYSNYATGHFQAGVALATNTTNGGALIGATTTGTELAYLSLGRNYNLSDVGEIALATGAAKKVIIGTANVARITAETSGDVTVNTGNLVVGTAGKGIAFPVTGGGSALAPAFSASLSGTQTCNASSATKLQFNTEQFDTNSNYDNSVNYRFTPTVTGYYQINVGLDFADVSSGSQDIFLRIYKNGAQYLAPIRQRTGAGQEYGVTASTLMYLNGSTDYVEVFVEVLAATNCNVYAGSYFNGCFLRP